MKLDGLTFDMLDGRGEVLEGDEEVLFRVNGVFKQKVVHQELEIHVPWDESVLNCIRPPAYMQRQKLHNIPTDWTIMRQVEVSMKM